MDNGWQLTTARIAGDEVVEVVLNGVPANRAEPQRYGLSEEIISYKRRWFVVLEEALAVLAALLVQRRPIRNVTMTKPCDYPNPARPGAPAGAGFGS